MVRTISMQIIKLSTILYLVLLFIFVQKEEKIRFLKMRLAEKDSTKGGGDGRSIGPPSDQTATLLAVNKDTLIVADFITDAGTSDSAFGGGVSVYTRSSRASASDFEFSESYL